jgi:NADPH:quinone reductase-like Zn-dependent oxidoreductase
MKAIQLHEYGGIDKFIYADDVAIPEPQTGEVLIKVHAAGINPLDCKIRAGKFAQVFPFQLPVILGMDVAGTIAAVGSGVTDLSVGQEVYGIATMARGGSYAEYAIASQEAIAPKPQTIDFVQSASIPVVAMTAWQSLFEMGNLSPGQTALIHAGAGGVGIFAVQLAKSKGVRVITTASTRNVEFVQNLGADQVIDYTQTKFEDVVKDVDLVLDPLGGETRERSWGLLKKGGILVSLITSVPVSQEIAEQYGVKAVSVHMKARSSE